MTAVSELVDAQLDYWAARADGVPAAQLRIEPVQRPDPRTPDCICVVLPPTNGFLFGPGRFDPSTNFAIGGALAFKHTIATAKGMNQITFPGWHAKVGMVAAYDTIIGRQFGPTPLVAAMRALVWSVYGDNVPDEVTP